MCPVHRRYDYRLLPLTPLGPAPTGAGPSGPQGFLASSLFTGSSRGSWCAGDDPVELDRPAVCGGSRCRRCRVFLLWGGFRSRIFLGGLFDYGGSGFLDRFCCGLLILWRGLRGRRSRRCCRCCRCAGSAGCRGRQLDGAAILGRFSCRRRGALRGGRSCWGRRRGRSVGGTWRFRGFFGAF